MNTWEYPIEKTVPYSKELWDELTSQMVDYYQTGYTVAGAEDPAVIYTGLEFRQKHPEFAGYEVCRVRDKYLNAWNSATFLEFSNETITEREGEMYEQLVQAQDAATV